jgi:hypothetical protein
MTSRTLMIACIVCATEFQATPAGRGRRPRFCSPRCRKARKVDQARAYPRGLSPLRKKSCPICDEVFSTRYPQKQCCGRDCGFELMHRRGAATREARRAERDTRVCRQCGASFVMRNRSGKARAGLSREGRFCSRDCAWSSRRRRLAMQLNLFENRGAR